MLETLRMEIAAVASEYLFLLQRIPDNTQLGKPSLRRGRIVTGSHERYFSVSEIL